jgi:hypothetical protein
MLEMSGKLVGILVLCGSRGCRRVAEFAPAILCSHCYVAFPHFEVEKEDQDDRPFDMQPA